MWVELVQVNALRQHADPRRLHGGQGRDVVHRRGYRLHQVFGAVGAIEPGHTDHQVVLLNRHRPARSICGDIAGGAVDLGVVDVAEPEFDLGTEVVAYAALQFRPARGGDDGVYA